MLSFSTLSPAKLAQFVLAVSITVVLTLFDIKEPYKSSLSASFYICVVGLTFGYVKGYVLIWTKLCMSQLQEIVVGGVKEVKEQIIDLGADGVGLNVKSMVKNFGNHKAGIGLCLKDIMTAEKPMQVASEIGKIGSLLGIETTLADTLVVGAANLLRPQELQERKGVDEIELRALEDVAPAAGMLLTLLGKEVGDVDISQFITQNANNTKNVKILVDNLTKAGESLGILKSSNFDMLTTLNEKTLALKTELKWLATVMAVDGVQVCTPKGAERVRKFEADLREVQTILHTTANTTLKNNAIYSTCQQINVEASKLIVLAEQLQKQQVRVKPVGVCFYGTTELGKTQLYQALIDLIKKKFQEKMITKMGSVENWQTWYVQWRDEYDTGYFGQEIVYVDDAFQDKSCKDHLMYYGFISNGPIGMVMARETEKGRPFNGKLVITSTNVLPINSITVNDISALHTRFPITVHVEKKSAFSATYDPTFSHLNFRMGHMRDMINDKFVSKQKITSLDAIAEKIVQQLEINHDFWCSVMKSHYPTIELRTQPEGEEFARFVPLGGYSDEEDLSVEEMSVIDEEEEFLDAFEAVNDYEAEIRDAMVDEQRMTRVQAVQVTGNYSEVIGQLHNEICNNLLRSFDNPPIEDALLLGEWVKDLKRKSDGKSGYEVIIAERPTAYEFLYSLGAYEMPDTPAFRERISHCGFIVVTHLEINYIWSPYLMNGTQMLIVHDEVKAIIAMKLMPLWRKVQVKSWKALRWVWSGERTRLALQRFLVGGVALVFVPEAVQLPAMAMMNNYLAIIPNYVVVPPVYNLFTWLERGHDMLFQRLTESLTWLKDGINSSLIRVLELIGVDITPFLREICKTVSEVATQSLILIITLLLAYAIYRLVMAFMPKKTEEITECSPRTVVRPAKKFNLINKRIQERNYEDDSACSVNNLAEYDVIHDGRDKETFSNGDFLGVIFEMYGQIEANTVAGELVKPFNSCYRALISDANDVVEQGSTCIRKYKLDKISKVLQLSMDLNGESLEDIKNIFFLINKKYKDLEPHDYEVHFTMSKEELPDDVENYFLKLDFIYRNRMQGGSVVNFVKRLVNDKLAEKDDFNGAKAKASETVDEILEHGEKAGLDEHQLVKRRHMVLISVVSPEELDSSKIGDRSMGLASGNHIYFNEHCAKVGQIVRFWHRNTYTSDTGDYQLAKVHTVDVLRDKAVAKILSRDEAILYIGAKSKMIRMATVKKVFPDIRSHLYDQKTFDLVIKGCGVMVYLPKQAIDIAGYAKDNGVHTYDLVGKGHAKSSHYIVIDRVSQHGKLSGPGDCGGVITNISDRWNNKVLGFFSAGSDKCWYGTYLLQEDIVETINECAESDPWEKLIVGGTPKDLPRGDEVEFVGRLIKASPPVFKGTLSHWHESPWSEQFEMQMEPSPLVASDPRITAKIMENQEGQPSLLMEQNSKMCCTLPEMDSCTLKKIEDQFTKEYAAKMNNIAVTTSDMEILLEEALNGGKDNVFVSSISTNKSAGLPWTLTPDMKKSDYLNVNPVTGQLTFNETSGQRLKKRIEFKLREAKAKRRLISFSNSKIKDALVKKKCVPIGKVRVYHCIPVDKIVCDAALFGNFKEAFMSRFVDMNHAVGTDPHTTDWNVIADKMRQHSNYFDVDFENYDKYLHGELMTTVFNIIRRVIQLVAPDEWDDARAILAEESIQTYVVDYDTVYKTKRGNKSGEFLTTIVNCIANDILSFYVWIKAVDNSDIQLFRENVNIVSFGDDKIESVSDTYADKYNYMTAKAVLEKVGHKITPGSKDGIEQPFTQFENLQFLKRAFKLIDGKWVAPLLQRSIESPFVWTQILENEHEIWAELIKQTIDEALLHSKEYFDEICAKLRKCENASLLMRISHIISRDYEAAKAAYFQRYLRK